MTLIVKMKRQYNKNNSSTQVKPGLKGKSKEIVNTCSGRSRSVAAAVMNITKQQSPRVIQSKTKTNSKIDKVENKEKKDKTVKAANLVLEKGPDGENDKIGDLRSPSAKRAKTAKTVQKSGIDLSKENDERDQITNVQQRILVDKNLLILNKGGDKILVTVTTDVNEDEELDYDEEGLTEPDDPSMNTNRVEQPENVSTLASVAAVSSPNADSITEDELLALPKVQQLLKKLVNDKIDQKFQSGEIHMQVVGSNKAEVNRSKQKGINMCKEYTFGKITIRYDIVYTRIEKNS